MLRRLQLSVIAGVLLAAAFSTGAPFLFYILYLSIIVVGGSYVLTRLGLTDLEAGYAVSQLSGHVGDQLRVTYTLRNAGRLPKLWLEAYNPTSLPGGLPGRAISLGPRAERSWLVRLPFARRGHFRIEPLLIRTGDPFGFFEASASVGQGVNIVIYPRVERLPLWRLPAANIEGSHALPERTLQTTPLVTTVRPWAPGDAFNRIAWKSTARHGDIQVKEFDLEQTADAWIFVDLDRAVQAGRGDDSTVEIAVRAAASVTDKAILENRAVGLTTNGHRLNVLPADRGGRQRQKIMQLLAAIEPDGSSPLAETLVAGLGRLRRGMTAIVITPSLDPTWVRPLATLRARGIGCIAVIVDPIAADRTAADLASAGRAGSGRATAERPADDPRASRLRAIHHALAEHDIGVRVLVPGRALGELLT